jgi:DNA-binding transcriptional regulator YdaS (Cro superfamily)
LLLALRSIGSLDRLAELLGVQPPLLCEWLSGKSDPPTEIYMRALDVVARGPFMSRTNGGKPGDKR